MKKIVLFAIITISLAGCYYDNLEEMHPKILIDTGGLCDTTSITYNNSVQSILANYCTASCHNVNNPVGGRMDSYAYAKSYAASGSLLSSITWDGNAPQMPSGSTTKINDCNIEQIRAWINKGIPE